MVYGVVSLDLPASLFLGSWRLVPGEPRAPASGRWRNITEGRLCGGRSFEVALAYSGNPPHQLAIPQDMSFVLRVQAVFYDPEGGCVAWHIRRVCVLRTRRDADCLNLTISFSFFLFLLPPRAPCLFFPH